MRRRAAVVLAVVVLAACTGDDSGSSARATRFRPTRVPDGYDLVLAGEGEDEPEPSSDHLGTIEPFLVLAENESLEGRVFVVSGLDFSALQSRLDQASTSFRYGAEPPEELRIGGRRALFTPAFELDGHRYPIDLVVDQGGGRALRFTGPRATRADLEALAARAVLRDEQRPAVPDPAEGLEVVSEISLDQASVLDGVSFRPSTAGVPGPLGTFVAGYQSTRAPVTTLVVASLDGGPEQLRATQLVGGGAHPVTEVGPINGEPAWLVDIRRRRIDPRRQLFFLSPSGNLMVVDVFGPDPPAREELVAMAEGIEVASEEEWEDLVSEASG